MATVEKSKPVEKQKSDVVLNYLRPKKGMPSVWCAGCGNGLVQSALVRAIDKLGYSKDEVALVSGIGCTSRMPIYLDFSALHTTHGRALAFATGVKFAKPKMKVIVITGDGDCLAIGGNHFIHACRRNIDITAILINNHIYGMTGGQGSPTTPTDAFSTTTPYGNVEKHFEPCELAQAAGASFVARATVYHTPQMEKTIMNALNHRGFSLVEVISNCHTYYGRLNRRGDAVSMLNNFKENSVTTAKAAKMVPEELDGKHVIGTLYEDDKTEFCDEYQKVVDAHLGEK
ncbi:MAG: 2-oxoacid:ferredoxin oxidoreductase subunit beta [candidate division Zixibacteria bacterium]|nr:2-oxoacid:ferredoxin oxidoreductase subunit beta [candidate division Zixibacteria bacterium]MDH3937933.1 2-oxoacid:ferredoxin oxidoreductase subunit beta [candidate division Zixibacteria bacterium]MDH4033442.1 2-oxoacid:ferredoxin oxidoreductase subunit beta [candidate division Zixibacteria bacterium]